MSAERDIVLVGTGNVAWHLARVLAPRIKAIVSRTPAHAKALADEAGIPCSGGLADVASFGPAVVIVSIADKALGEAVEAIGALPGDPLVVHTSGTLAKEMLTPLSRRTGILYPLQTFTRGVETKLDDVPVFVECADAADYPLIEEIAGAISGVVHRADATTRPLLHIAGVFTSNFVNILLEIAGDVLARGGYPLSCVRPLAEATVRKAFELSPHLAQTGPALRGDGEVMRRQAAALDPQQADVYRLLSDYIIRSHNVEVK